MTTTLNSRRLALLSGSAVLALAIASASPVLAQTAADQAVPATGATAEAGQDAGAPIAAEAGREQSPTSEDGTEVEAVVVTGFRAAVEQSISVKRRAEQIVESVSAEDIGKLPDNSIAEAIARLPGLTAQRLDGRAQTVSIRGLSSDFSTTLLNGREQVTAGDNRGVEFDQYPSEVVNQVVVYKTPEAGVVGQGLSGTVDLRTVRPLDYGRQAISVGLRRENVELGQLNAGSEDTGYRANFTYIDQFANDTIGVSLGIAHLESPTQIERFNAWGYPEVSAGGPRVIGGSKPYVVSTNLKRTGVIGALDFQPTDRFRATIDGYYSKFEDAQILRGVELPLFWGSGTALQPGFTAENGLVTQGVFSNVKGVVRNDANTRDADLYSLGLNVEYELDENWTIVGDASVSSVERTDQIVETYSGTGRGLGSGATDTIGFGTGASGTRFAPTLNYADPALIQLTSPQGWGGDVIPGGQDGYLNMPSIKDELVALRGEIARELGDTGLSRYFSRVEFGVNLTDREKSFTPDQFFLGLKANAADPLRRTSVPIPTNLLLQPTQLAYLGIPGVVSYDPFAVIGAGLYNLVRNPNADVASAGWTVNEKVTTAYVKLDIDTTAGAAEVGGNVGLQVIHTEQSSDGIAATGNGGSLIATPRTDGADYTEALPSLNLSFRFPQDHTIRLGLSRQLARTRMDDMRASINFGYNPALASSTDISNSPWSGGGGNPRLRPFIAKAFDVSYEKYFGTRAYYAVAAFYKDLETYVANVNRPYDFTGFPVTSGPEPALRVGLVNTPQNLSGGFIRGLESSISLPGELIVPALEGFGASASYSYTESEITPDPTQDPITIPGLSKHVANFTVYYERFGFSARTSARYRSSFLGEVAGFGNARTFRNARAETVWDAQLGYQFQTGPLEGLSLLLQGQNLTNEPFVTQENDDERRVIDYQEFGRRYLFGVSYRF
jgi:iron complex outermembrane receptor protein